MSTHSATLVMLIISCNQFQEPSSNLWITLCVELTLWVNWGLCRAATVQNLLLSSHVMTPLMILQGEKILCVSAEPLHIGQNILHICLLAYVYFIVNILFYL